ncbi:MAG TPA: hypothetical protein VNV44_08495 [Solirubrobacteraceae bacterium]|jgi:hypothetical protein|nr:hypothetical protein [Solirubrobacteraceae bacterium]
MSNTVYRQCNLGEAHCGIRARLTGNAASNDVAVRSDAVAAPAREPAELGAVGA